MERRFERGIGRSTEKKKNNVSRGGIKSPEKINYDDQNEKKRNER